MKSLNAGACPVQAKFGFVHPEPAGVLAIDQKGGGQGLKETRLYIFPDVTEKVVYLLTIGEKSDQGADIAKCKKFVEDLRNERESNGDE